MCQNLSIKVNVFLEGHYQNLTCTPKIANPIPHSHSQNKSRPFKFFLAHWSGFLYIQPITMHILAKRHCDWLTIRKAGAPEIQKARKPKMVFF